MAQSKFLKLKFCGGGLVRLNFKNKNKNKNKIENARDLVELGEGKWRLARSKEKGISSFQLFLQQIRTERYPVWKHLLGFAGVLIVSVVFLANNLSSQSLCPMCQCSKNIPSLGNQ